MDTEADGQIRAEMAQLQERLHKLHATLEGPRVELEVRWCDGHVTSYSGTLAEAFASDDEIYGEPVAVNAGGCWITREEWEIDPRNPDAAEEIQRRADRAAEETRKAAEKAAKEAELERWRQETMVALFDADTDTQVSEWVPFATGKAPVPDEWVKGNKLARNIMPTLQLRMQNGNGVSAARPSVQEVITKTYAITWRTVW